MKNSQFHIQQRRKQILQYLETNKEVTTTELASYLGTSLVTIRRDLAEMEAKGLLHRSYGGASIPSNVGQDGTAPARLSGKTPYQQESEHDSVQRLLAQYAATFIRDGDVILMNSSHTVSYITEYITSPNTIVLSNNLYILDRNPAPGISLAFTGGIYCPGQASMTGGIARNEIQKVVAGLCFIGAAGISAEGGVTSPYLEESYINSAMIEQTEGQVILVAEGYKIGRNDRFFVSDFSKIDLLITDSSADPRETAALRKRGLIINVIGEDGRVIKDPR